MFYKKKWSGYNYFWVNLYTHPYLCMCCGKSNEAVHSDIIEIKYPIINVGLPYLTI